MYRMTRIALGSFLAARSVADLCPYNDWAAKAIQTYNANTKSYEIVDQNCTVLPNTTKFQAVGDISAVCTFDCSGMTLTYTDRPELIDLANGTFPNVSYSELSLRNIGATSIASQNTILKATSLSLQDMTLDAIPVFTGDVTLSNVTLVNASSFQNLNPRDLYISNMKNFQFQDIAWKYMSFLGFTDVSDLTIANVKVQGINRLQLVNVFTLAIDLDIYNFNELYIDSSNLSNWVMDNRTYNSLASFSRDLSSSSVMTVNQTYCTSKGGTVQPLWSSDTNEYSVCVLAEQTLNVNVGLTEEIVIGIVVFLAIVSVRFRSKRVAEYQTIANTNNDLSPEEENRLNMQDLVIVRIDAKDVVLNTILGSGAFADVWLGTYRGELVAIKKLHPRTVVTVLQLQSFVDEIKLMIQFKSIHIVKLIGACWTCPRTLKCIMELMDGGDLRSYLAVHNHREFTWSDKYIHIHSIIEGLVYLHSRNIVHRDLKSRNILLDSIKGTKLTDFGISKDEKQMMTMGVGTTRWMAPEVLRENHYTVAADIFSFGMILFEFDAHQIPYHDLKNSINGQLMTELAISNQVASGTLRPTFSTQIPAWLRAIAVQCLGHNPDERPTALELSVLFQTGMRPY
ncbi:Aste57867_11266 [Aphanomyces stellatus]|uniref:Aste57867_11266 protein n=1 Tax=Aphanomyces stellatus TaxID=120398 RepID=A0A485KSF4_9STRA|nr:hypothetical protein As57867_011224 [Aphanomyces stellatus]VFT88129.1 Aste57867_11266 [Aphanomyces stellatus]